MSKRRVYVYRIDVTYPTGSEVPGWEPDGWLADSPYNPDPEADDSFRWPENRLCLSAGTARRRAGLFRQYGATATVKRSEAVTWPEVPDE